MRHLWGKNKTKLIIWSFIIVLLLSPVGRAGAQVKVDQEEDIALLERYWEIYHYLKEYHVSAPSAEQLADWALMGMFFSLDDPYTYYMTEEEYSELVSSINGQLVGLGIVLTINQEGIMLEDIIAGSPAAKSGLQLGDLLTHVDGTGLEDVLLLEEVLLLISGEAGEDVTLTIDRWQNAQKKSFSFTLQREVIDLPLVEARMLDDQVGYLKLRSFGENAHELVSKHIVRLERAGMEQLVLDLRGNSGGFMDMATELAKLFKESGTLLHLKDNTGSLEAYTFDGGASFSHPMVVLVDQGTASAAEVLAGFLQDEELGHLLGDATYGKGTIQDLVELESGGVLRVTVQEYFTPKKNQVHIYGIEPDTTVLNRKFQLAKAYGWLTGREELQLSKNGTLLLNGLEEPTLRHSTYIEDGNIYLSVRTLIEWYNGHVEWDSKAKVIEIFLDDIEVRLPSTDQALKLINSMAYISVEQMVAWLPFSVEGKGDSYLIRRK